MSQVSLTEFQQNIEAYLDRAVDDREPLVVTRQGKGNVVVISEEEFGGWKETVHLLSSPRNAERLLRSIRQVKAGETRERELIANPNPQHRHP